MPLPYMSPAEREAAILNHIRINEVMECILHQMNIIQAMARDNLMQSTANAASLTAQLTGGVHGFIGTVGGGGGYRDHPLKTQYVIREFRMDRQKQSGLNAMIGTLKPQHVDHIRLSVRNHTVYAHRVCCFAACEDIDDLVNMWSLLNFVALFLSVHSADESTREELKKYAFDPFSVTANIEKQENMHLTPTAECAAKLLVGYFSGPKLGPAASGFCGSFMTEAIVFNRMLLELFVGVDFVGRIANKNLDFIVFSLQVICCIGPGFIDLGAEPIMVSTSGLLTLGCLDASDELADAGAKKATEGLHLERLIGKLYVVGDSSGCCSEGLLLSCSKQWDGKAFQFDSARFGCFYTAVLRQRLVVSGQVVFEGENCHVPSITSKIVPKGRRSFEVARSIGPCATMSIAAILPEYFSTASVTKKHTLGRIPIVLVLSAGRRPVPGQVILEACSYESEELLYLIGEVCYVSPAKGTILPYSAEMQPAKNLEIDPLEMYEIVVDGIEELTLIEELSQRVAQL